MGCELFARGCLNGKPAQRCRNPGSRCKHPVYSDGRDHGSGHIQFTTDGISFSAKSAKDFGTASAFAKSEKFKNTIEIKIILRFLSFILFFNIPNNKKANYCKN